MSDDITRNTEIFGGDIGDNVSDETLSQYVLYELEFLLNSHSTDSSLKKFGLPMPNTELIRSLRNRLLMEEKNYDREHLLKQHQEYLQQLHPQQHAVYDHVVSALESNTQVLAFVYGHGGTGKIVLAIAASDIALLLLLGGRTAHSRFKIPIDLTDHSNCNISKSSYLSQLLVETELIIWDEAPMSNRKCFEALDRTLKDILNNSQQSFGGKSVLLGGDFRQTLPIKRKATKSQIISDSLPWSYLWSKFRIFKLAQNMRVHRPNMTPDVALEIQNFSDWLVCIGNGLSGVPDDQQNDSSRTIEIPSKYIIPNNSESLHKLVSFIYDQTTLINPTPSDLAQKAIVCPKNETADHVNQIILDMLPGVATTYVSNDVAVPHPEDNTDIETLYPVKYLNTIKIPGYPAHKLQLKVNVPIILLRNINQTAGLYYIGCLVAIKPSDDADEDNRRDFLTLKNDSNKSVRVTLWPEIRKTFDQSVVENTDAPVVVAITSTKVGNLIYGDMQLSSTPATAVFVNPPIPELPDLKKR
ncbi:uncharacterized protein LOC143584447 [Bidens hawaiensis]|uniref:uncharacterized protein LOC143584447 n=1 Tax=Bidens hawaiensis TaxID=980011 RepID=UPI004049DF4C